MGAESAAKSFGSTSTLCYLDSSSSLTLAFLYLRDILHSPRMVSAQVSWDLVDGERMLWAIECNVQVVQPL
jgi:hypothetical protein